MIYEIFPPKRWPITYRMKEWQFRSMDMKNAIYYTLFAFGYTFVIRIYDTLHNRKERPISLYTRIMAVGMLNEMNGKQIRNFFLMSKQQNKLISLRLCMEFAHKNSVKLSLYCGFRAIFNSIFPYVPLFRWYAYHKCTYFPHFKTQIANFNCFVLVSFHNTHTHILIDCMLWWLCCERFVSLAGTQLWRDVDENSMGKGITTQYSIWSDHEFPKCIKLTHCISGASRTSTVYEYIFAINSNKIREKFIFALALFHPLPLSPPLSVVFCLRRAVRYILLWSVL